MSENIFHRAADRLRGRWHQGWLNDRKGNVCAIGALCDVVEDQDDVYLLWDFADRVTIEETDGRFRHIDNFNDAPGTTEEDVLLMLKKVAVAWDEQSA